MSAFPPLFRRRDLARKAHDPARSQLPRRCRDAANARAWRRRVPPVVSSGRARRARIQSRRLRGDAPGHRSRVSRGVFTWRSVAGRQERESHSPFHRENEHERFLSLGVGGTGDQFDSLVQTLGGFNVQEAEAYAEYIRETEGEEAAAKLPPYRKMPMQALDHAAGYLLAFGIAAALCKTVTVRISSLTLSHSHDPNTTPSSGGRIVARTRLAERDAPLDPTLRIRAPAHRIRRGRSPPSTLDASRPGGRGRVYDDRARSGGFWARGRGRTDDVGYTARG